MVRKTLLRKCRLVGVLAVAMMVMTCGAAAAAPQTMSLSSWESTVVNGRIVGGDRTVVVTNITDAPLVGHTVDLGETPCACAIADVSSGQTIDANVWFVQDLAPGESASVTLRYESPQLRVPAVAFNAFPESAAVIAVLVLAALGAATVAGRHRLALDF